MNTFKIALKTLSRVSHLSTGETEAILMSELFLPHPNLITSN